MKFIFSKHRSRKLTKMYLKWLRAACVLLLSFALITNLIDIRNLKHVKAAGTQVMSGLQFYYNGDGKTNPSTTWEDLSGNNRPATLTNFAKTTSSGWNNAGALTFDGSNDYASITYNPMTSVSAFSFETVFSIATASASMDFYSFSTSSTPCYLNITNNTLTLSEGATKITLGTYSFTANVRYHLLLVRSTSNAQVYINNALVFDIANAMKGNGKVNAGTSFRLGQRYDGTNSFSGNMYIARWYNRALTSEEVAQNYNDAAAYFPSKPVITASPSSYGNSPISVAISSSDTPSKVLKIEYRVNDGEFSTYASALNFSAEGTYTIDARTVWMNGLVSDLSSSTVGIDTGAPSVSANPATLTLNDNIFSIDVTYSDAITGIKEKYYKWDSDTIIEDNTWNNYTGPVSCSKEQTSYLQVKAVDNAGNITIKSFGPYSVVHQSYVKNGLQFYFNAKGKTNPSTIWEDLTANHHDATLNGFAGTSVSGWSSSDALTFDGSGDFVNIPNYVPMTTDSDFTFEEVLEVNSSTALSELFSFGVSGSRCYVYYNTGFTVGLGAANVSLDIIAAGSVLTPGTKYHIVITRDSTGLKSYINNIPTGTYAIGYQGAISLGTGYLLGKHYDSTNQLAGKVYLNRWYNRALSVDEVALNYNNAMKYTPSTPSITVSPAVSEWINSDAAVSIASSDDPSKISGLEYQLDDGAWTPYYGPFTILDSKLHTVGARAVSTNGVYSDSATTSVKIDKNPPSVLPSPPPPSSASAPYDVTLAFSDSLSGVKETYYKWDSDNTVEDSGWTPYTSGARKSVDGVQYLQVKALDNAGNTLVSSIGSYDLDTRAPVISNVLVSAVTADSATIDFDLDEYGDSLIEYGKTASLGMSKSSADFSLHHFAVLDSLEPGTTYYFRIKSKDSSGNAGINDNSGQMYIFTTASNEPTISCSLDNNFVSFENVPAVEGEIIKEKAVKLDIMSSAPFSLKVFSASDLMSPKSNIIPISNLSLKLSSDLQYVSMVKNNYVTVASNLTAATTKSFYIDFKLLSNPGFFHDVYSESIQLVIASQ